MPAQHQSDPRITVFQGSSIDAPDVEAAFPSAPPFSPIRAVIVALNLAARARLTDLLGVSKRNVRKLVVMSAIGADGSWSAVPRIVKLLSAWSNISYPYADHGVVDGGMNGEGLEWVEVRPEMLTDRQKMPIREYGVVDAL